MSDVYEKLLLFFGVFCASSSIPLFMEWKQRVLKQIYELKQSCRKKVEGINEKKLNMLENSVAKSGFGRK